MAPGSERRVRAAVSAANGAAGRKDGRGRRGSRSPPSVPPSHTVRRRWARTCRRAGLAAPVEVSVQGARDAAPQGDPGASRALVTGGNGSPVFPAGGS